jgi:site-specific DNA-cytosine methylase
MADDLKLSTAFTWAPRMLTALQNVHGKDALKHSKLWSEHRLSSHFSGIGTVEMACQCLTAGAPQAFGRPVLFHPMLACESNTGCQRLLSARLPREAHLFGDIMERIPQTALCHLGKEVCLSGDLRACVQGLGVVDFAACTQHGGQLCRAPPVSIDISGPPCVDWSLKGKRRGLLGPTCKVLLAWAAVQRAAPGSICSRHCGPLKM